MWRVSINWLAGVGISSVVPKVEGVGSVRRLLVDSSNVFKLYCSQVQNLQEETTCWSTLSSVPSKGSGVS